MIVFTAVMLTLVAVAIWSGKGITITIKHDYPAPQVIEEQTDQSRDPEAPVTNLDQVMATIHDIMGVSDNG